LPGGVQRLAPPHQVVEHGVPERNVRQKRIASEGGWGAYFARSREDHMSIWELATQMKADAISERGWPAQPD
jgi:hypothetical protein